jgi:hypothetical protein
VNGSIGRHSHIRYFWELMPRKCHIIVMTKGTSDSANSIIELGRSVDRVVALHPSSRGIRLPAPIRGAAIPAARADKWIDELEWLAGFPSQWGERRGGWFGGI